MQIHLPLSAVELTFLCVLSLALCAPVLPTSVRRRGGVSFGRAAAAASVASASRHHSRTREYFPGTSGSNEKEEPACFPADATVRVADRVVRMDALRVGDAVETGTGPASPVYMFSHAVPTGLFNFIRLTTPHGALTASPGHHVHTVRGTLPARSVVVGDLLRTMNGSLAHVLSTARVREAGLYNPHTLSGNIAVDGFSVSTFTEAVPAAAASALLAPARSAFLAAGIDASAGTLTEDFAWRRTLLGVLRAGRSSSTLTVI